jgi:NifU-like protein involved in Fe-S cluster formation
LHELLVRGAGAGSLSSGEGVVGRGGATHPACGDEVEVDVRVVDGRIRELRWRAQACPASTAVAALAAEVLHDVPAADAVAHFEQAAAAVGGLAGHERHAIGLVGRALAAAVAEVTR